MASVRILSGLGRVAHRHTSSTFRGWYGRSAFSTSSAMSVHLKYEVKDGVGLITFDSPGKVNTLSRDVLAEFGDILGKLESDPAVKSAVLVSGKPDCFIAGADIAMLQSCESSEEVETLSKSGQVLLQKVEDCKKPIVAAIMGSCLGGGLEVALACHYRIAAKTSKTQLGTPEVLLGLLPGGGGTQRLPPLVSVPVAFDMMLTGRNIRPDKAKKMGLVDQLVEPLGPGIDSPANRTRDYLQDIALGVAKGLANGSVKKTPKKKGLMDKVMGTLLSYDIGRNYVINQVKSKVMKQTQGNYPAPLKIIDVVKTSLEKGKTAGYAAEAKGFGELGMTSESNALMGLFHGQTACKKNPYGVPQKKVETLAVLGAGLMGAGIAHVSVEKAGTNVILKDMAQNGITRGQQQIEKGFTDAIKKKKMTKFQADTILSNLDCTLSYENFSKVDMVIEAVFEDIDIKHKVIKEVEAVVPPHCVIATNTSSLFVRDIAKASRNPGKVIGIHYFSPVEKMDLVEIIKTEDTTPDTIATAVDFCLRQGKTVIVVKDGPGFLTSRCINAYMSLGALLYRQCPDIERIDRVCKKGGFPVGMVTLFDEIGFDVMHKVSHRLGNIFGDRIVSKDTLALSHTSHVEMKLLGRKGGKGFYLYENGKRTGVNPQAQEIWKKHAMDPLVEMTDDNIIRQLVLKFTDEAVRCFEEGIIESPVVGDVGMVFGVGYPPHLGGPFRYVDSIGADKIVAQMREYEAVYGKIFTPCQLLVDMANDPSKKFHKR